MDMRELISPEEFDALFSSSSSADFKGNSLKPERPPDDDIGMDIPRASAGPEDACDGSNDGAPFASGRPIPAPISALYESLSLSRILWQSRHALKNHFDVEFFTLVQPRKSRNMVTVYSSGDDEEKSYGYPKIIELGPSRLSDCMLVKQRILKYVAEEAELDGIEKCYLIPDDIRKSDFTILYWPVIFIGDLKGVLVLGLSGKAQLSEDQNRLLLQLCRHLPVAIKNSDSHYSERRRGRQLEMLSEIASEAISESDFKSFLSKVCKSIRKSFDYNSVQVWIGSGSRLDMAGENSKYEMSKCARQAADPIVHECWGQNRILSKNYSGSESGREGECAGKSCFVVPMHLKNERIGVLFIESSQLDAFSTEDIGVVKSMASIIASRYINIRMLKEYQRSGEYLKAVLESADDWAIIFTDNHGYALSCSVGVEKIFDFSQKQTIGRDVLTLFDETRLQRDLLTFMKDENGSVRFQNHQVIQGSSENERYFDVSFQRVRDSEKKQIGFACVVQDMTEKVQQEKKLKEQSYTDDLTSLYNQRGFIRTIKKDLRICKSLGCTLSLCFMDLDHLKRCNDTYGHLYGSRAIREAAQILRQSVRPQDTCFRYGGDEFVIIMPQFSKHEAQPVIEKIRVTISEHFDKKITASFGIADYSEDVSTVTALLAKADAALYQAKSLGRNTVVIAD